MGVNVVPAVPTYTILADEVELFLFLKTQFQQKLGFSIDPLCALACMLAWHQCARSMANFVVCSKTYHNAHSKGQYYTYDTMEYASQ